MRNALFAATLLAVALPAQVTTTFAGGNGQSGNMFDIQANNAAGVTIKRFDVNVDAGTWDFEVYVLTNPGPYLPSVNNSADWTLVGAATGVVSNGPGVPTPLPIDVCEYIPAGATQGFYVTVTNGTAINYTNGSLTGAAFASNADLTFFEGSGLAYPFSANFNPRIFNGNIYYNTGPGPNCGSGGTQASIASYGNVGCYDEPFTFSEYWSPNSTIDLVNTSWILQYNPGSNNYTVIAGGLPYDNVIPPLTGVDLVTLPYTSASSGSWDDASIVQPLGFTLPYPNATGATTTDITINSNGRVVFANVVDNTFQFNGANSLLAPGIFSGQLGPGVPNFAAFMNDLDPTDPTNPGSIWFEATSPSGGVRITWDGLSNWASGNPPAVLNYIQLEILPTGTMFLSYGSSLGNGGSVDNEAIVGYSDGTNTGNAAVDFSTLAGWDSGIGTIGLRAYAEACPVLGSSVDVNVENIASGALLGGITFSTTQFSPGISLLAPLGVPCDLYAPLDFVSTGLLPAGSFTAPLGIPNNAALSGVQIFAQGFTLNPSIPNPIGARTSNGLALTLGN